MKQLSIRVLDPTRPEFAEEAERGAKLLRGGPTRKKPWTSSKPPSNGRTLKRSDLVIVSARGDYGKPRPAAIIQSDLLPTTDSVLVMLLTSTLADAPLYRLHVEPTPINGLKVPSQVMVG